VKSGTTEHCIMATKMTRHGWLSSKTQQ